MLVTSIILSVGCFALLHIRGPTMTEGENSTPPVLVYRGGGHSTPEARLSGTPHVYSAWNPGRVDPLIVGPLMFKSAKQPTDKIILVTNIMIFYRSANFSAAFCLYLYNQLHMKKYTAQHSNELAKGYTLIPITIFIDKCLLGDIEKLVVFSRICRISRNF